ncbi:PHP domain-containing protein [Longispora albida]|uniref:PHP domain-containing protein n=1 Tax=Longispora albida TaxID=203523 RepID=UPI000366B3E5|nr:PHP domain-containing protein [Longispora albida]
MSRDPVADLQAIAFALERAGEATYRVKAFRGAAATIAALPPTELARRAADGTLTELPGVGDVTARCVAESVSGREPEYLARAQEKSVQQLGPEASALLEALRGDCHSHSDWSDGGSPIEEMAVAAVALGHEYLVLTDHSPRLTVARGLSPDRLREQLGVVAAMNDVLAPDFRLLTGIEVDILDDGGLDQEPELLAELGVVVASVHSKLRDPSDVLTPRMLAAVANPDTDILGHCTGRIVAPSSRRAGGKTRPESTFDAGAVFAACAERGVAVEINCRPDRLDPPRRLLREAVEAGCLFSIDTDAHAPGQLSWQGNGCTRAIECGVPQERVVNTWPLPDLLAWAADHSHRPG